MRGDMPSLRWKREGGMSSLTHELRFRAGDRVGYLFTPGDAAAMIAAAETIEHMERYMPRIVLSRLWERWSYRVSLAWRALKGEDLSDE